MPKKIVAIHQPDFFPWLGFFNKISKVDTLVVLDHVVNNPRAGFWCKRVKLLMNKEPQWLTIPLEKPRQNLFIPINHMKIKIGDRNFEKKHLSTIQQNYSKAPFFSEVFPLVKTYYEQKETNLSVRNMSFISHVFKILDLQPEILYSSKFNCKKNASQLLVEVLEEVGGTDYICGAGAKDYQDNDLFTKAGIKVLDNNFKHPEYVQYNVSTFVSGLSIIDALMNIGAQGVKEIL